MESAELDFRPFAPAEICAALLDQGQYLCSIRRMYRILDDRLIRETVVKQGIVRDQLTLHSDRGPSMRSQTVAQLLATLGISSDFPGLDAAAGYGFLVSSPRPVLNEASRCSDPQEFNRHFLNWLIEYNFHRSHIGLNYLRPIDVAFGGAKALPMYPSHTSLLTSGLLDSRLTV